MAIVIESIMLKSSNFSTSTGDEAGSAQGVVSNKIKGKAEFVNYSFDTKFEGKNVARAFDLMLHNDKNTPPFPVLQGPLIAMPSDIADDEEDPELVEVKWVSEEESEKS